MTEKCILSPIHDIIDDLRNGKMVILVDDEDRENEGDLILSAQMVTPDAINFMAKHGRGLICLSMTSARVKELQLPPMTHHNETPHGTAFTLAIDAASGITTGISAADRAHTIATAINPMKGRQDLVVPGHIFPLEAKDGGVLVRTGHTEAAVDLAKLAGHIPAGVICEIINDDGSMARLPDLIVFAEKHNLKIGKIADLISYRLQSESLIERCQETTLQSRYGGDFRLITYRSSLTGTIDYMALVKGNVSPLQDNPVWVRMHALSIFDDVLGNIENDRAGDLQKAMQMIADHGQGVIVVLRDMRASGLFDSASIHSAHHPNELRHYGLGAQILRDLHVRKMILLSNHTHTIVGLEGFGLEITDRLPLQEIEPKIVSLPKSGSK